MSYLEQVVRNAEEYEHHATSYFAELLRNRVMEANLAANNCSNVCVGDITSESLAIDGMSFQEELIMNYEEDLFFGFILN